MHFHHFHRQIGLLYEVCSQSVRRIHLLNARCHVSVAHIPSQCLFFSKAMAAGPVRLERADIHNVNAFKRSTSFSSDSRFTKAADGNSFCVIRYTEQDSSHGAGETREKADRICGVDVASRCKPCLY